MNFGNIFSSLSNVILDNNNKENTIQQHQPSVNITNPLTNNHSSNPFMGNIPVNNQNITNGKIPSIHLQTILILIYPTNPAPNNENIANPKEERPWLDMAEMVTN